MTNEDRLRARIAELEIRLKYTTAGIMKGEDVASTTGYGISCNRIVELEETVKNQKKEIKTLQRELRQARRDKQND